VASKYTSRLRARESVRFPHHHFVKPLAGFTQQSVKTFTLEYLDHESNLRLQMPPGKLQGQLRRIQGPGMVCCLHTADMGRRIGQHKINSAASLRLLLLLLAIASDL